MAWHRNAVCATRLVGKPTSKTAFCARSVMQTPDFRRTRCASCADALRIQAGFCHRAGNRRCHAAAGASPGLHCRPSCIREELTGLLCGRYVQRTLMAYADLITSALPELAPMQGCQQQNPHHLYDVWEHTVRAVGQVPAEPVLGGRCCCTTAASPPARPWTSKASGISGDIPRRALRCRASSCRGCGSRARTPNASSCWSSGTTHRSVTNEKLVRRSLSRIGEARFRDLLAIKKGDAVGQGTSRDYVAQLFETEALLNRVLAQEQCFSLRQLAVNGADLQALGLRRQTGR